MAAHLHHFFPRNVSFSYEALRTAGYANYGGGDLGEVISICSRIPSGDEDSWMKEWRMAGDRACAAASKSLAAKNKVSSREAYLRASNYYRTAEFYRREHPEDDEVVLSLSNQSWASFVSAMKLMPYAFEEIKIPYEETTLLGYILSPGKTNEPCPTIVFNGGFDSIKEEAWFAIAAPALERGFNVVAFDGPGQGEALRAQRLVFRPDWENVLTPVIDYVVTRPEVSPEKVFLFGWSMGGYLAARAMTSEHRLAAAVLDDGVLDFSSAFNEQMPAVARQMLHRHWDYPIQQGVGMLMSISTGVRWAMLNGRWAFGADTVPDLLRKVQDYTLVGITDKITTPVLVLDAPDDHMLKGQPKALFDALKCEKVFVDITELEGGSTHCHMGAFSRLHQVIFDYLMPLI
jgi:pimeloyl-ACP methyl ester carboxylesterase